MKILLLHLSDIHLKEGSSAELQENFKWIAKATTSKAAEVSAILLTVSGDIAFSGKREQYQEAGALLDDLKICLTNELPEIPIYEAFVPGNHDCDMSKPEAARNMLISAIKDKEAPPIDNSVIEQCCKPQDHFFEFFAQRKQLPESSLYWEERILLGDYTICIRSFNTAWISCNPEIQGGLQYPTEVVRPLMDQSSADLSISILHHPYAWFNSKTNNHLRVRDLVEPVSDIILTGHEHEGSFHQSNDLQNSLTTCVEGCLLNGHGSESRFNLILVDLATQQECLHEFCKGENRYEEQRQTEWTAYTKGPRGQHPFQLSQSTIQWMDDCGAVFSHPTKEVVGLNDIFVPPNLRRVSVDKNNPTALRPIVSATALLKDLPPPKHLFLCGPEQSGRTTLAKVLFRRAYDLKLLPLYIDGQMLGNRRDGKHTAKSLQETLQTEFTKQYAQAMLPAFQQHEASNTLVIIDGIDRCKLSAKGRIHILDTLLSLRYRLIVLAGDTIRFEDFALGEASDRVLGKFDHYDILEFGHVLRSRLVEKWYRLDAELVTDETILLERAQKAETTINGLLGKSYLPSFPIYVLTFLQALDSSQPVQSNAGTYGSLYEILISQQLARAPKGLSFDTRKTYLSWLAHWMFEKQQRSIAQDGWNLCHNKYCQHFRLRYPLPKVVEDLTKTGLIVERDHAYSFQHPYAYFYFVAKYLAENIHEDAVKETIRTLCTKLHREEHASIWLFLTHLSKDPFLIQTIVEHARAQYGDTPEAAFGDDVEFLNGLYSSIPKIVLKDRDFQIQKRERLEVLDQQGEENTPETDQESEESREIGAKLNAALRTLEILGQLVKNFSGSLKGTDKEKIADEAYSLGLRTAGYMLAAVRDHGEQFIKDCIALIRDKFPNLAQQDVEKEVRKLVFFFVEMMAFSMVKRVSQSVGHPDLEETYAELVAKDSVTNARKLVDLSVQLDSLKFPEDTLKERAAEFAKNIFSQSLLRRLVVHHFYLYHKPFTLKQRVCASLDIPIEKIHSLELIGSSNKRVPPPPSKSG